MGRVANTVDFAGMVMIDQGFCFGGRRWNCEADVRCGMHVLRPSIYSSIQDLQAFEPWLDRLEHEINRDVLEGREFARRVDVYARPTPLSGSANTDFDARCISCAISGLGSQVAGCIRVWFSHLSGYAYFYGLTRHLRRTIVRPSKETKAGDGSHVRLCLSCESGTSQDQNSDESLDRSLRDPRRMRGCRDSIRTAMSTMKASKPKCGFRGKPIRIPG